MAHNLYYGYVKQRLMSADGKTCERCNATYREMQQSITKLKEVLRPLGIEPALEIREIDQQSFKANPSESNRICSRCCSVCGESPCRTVAVEGTMFEAIPENLLIKAALVASSHLLGPASDC